MTQEETDLKVDLQVITKGIKQLEHPALFMKYNMVASIFAARADDDIANEIWEEDGDVVMTLTIPFQFCQSHNTEQVTDFAINLYRQYIGQVTAIPALSSLEEN